MPDFGPYVPPGAEGGQLNLTPASDNLAKYSSSTRASVDSDSDYQAPPREATSVVGTPSRPISRSSTFSGLSTTATKDGIEGKRIKRAHDPLGYSSWILPAGQSLHSKTFSVSSRDSMSSRGSRQGSAIVANSVDAVETSAGDDEDRSYGDSRATTPSALSPAASGDFQDRDEEEPNDDAELKEAVALMGEPTEETNANQQPADLLHNDVNGYNSYGYYRYNGQYSYGDGEYHEAFASHGQHFDPEASSSASRTLDATTQESIDPPRPTLSTDEADAHNAEMLALRSALKRKASITDEASSVTSSNAPFEADSASATPTVAPPNIPSAPPVTLKEKIRLLRTGSVSGSMAPGPDILAGSSSEPDEFSEIGSVRSGFDDSVSVQSAS